jgi:endonuclease/exonuclease/phosphatase (EEP) superfamily protein YafD
MKTETKTPDFFRISIRPWGLITAAGAIAGTASILGFLGAYNWFLDLCSHFRVQYSLGLGVVAALLLIRRKRRLAAVFGALAVLNLGVILPLYFGRAPVPVASGRSVRVRAMLANVNTKTGDATAVAAAIRRFDPDIVVLEEVSSKWLSDLKPVLDGYRHSEQMPREDNFGIGLWSKFPFSRSRIAYIGMADIPSIVAEIDATQGKFTLVATHPLPPGGKEYSEFRNGQLAELPRWVRQASSPVVLLGDLNVTPWNYYFKRLLRQSGLKDSAQGRGVRPTWPTFNPLMLIPIDHCLYSHGIEIVTRETGPQVGSDHFPVIVDFVIRGEKKTEANQASDATAEPAPDAASSSHQG